MYGSGTPIDAIDACCQVGLAQRSTGQSPAFRLHSNGRRSPCGPTAEQPPRGAAAAHSSQHSPSHPPATIPARPQAHDMCCGSARYFDCARDAHSPPFTHSPQQPPAVTTARRTTSATTRLGISTAPATSKSSAACRRCHSQSGTAWFPRVTSSRSSACSGRPQCCTSGARSAATTARGRGRRGLRRSGGGCCGGARRCERPAPARCGADEAVSALT